MIHIQTQRFYSRSGEAHDISIMFGGINPMDNGHYSVLVDGQTHSTAKFKGKAFDAVVQIIKENDWTPIKH